MTSNTLRVDNGSSRCTTPSDRPDRPDHRLTAVKVGCLHINLATTRGRRIFMLQMLVLCFVPHAALVIQNCSVMAQLSHTLDSALYLHKEVNSILTLGDTVVAVQEERVLVSKYLSDRPNQHTPQMYELEQASMTTDSLLEEAPHSVLREYYKDTLYRFREDVARNKDSKKSDLRKGMSIYQEINSILLQQTARLVKSTAPSLWRQLSACYEFVLSMEELSLALVSVAELYDQDHLIIFQQHQALGLDHLGATVQFLQAENTIEQFRSMEEVLEFYKGFPLLRNETLRETKAGAWMIYYTLESEDCLNKLKVAQADLWDYVQESVSREVWLARRTLGIGVAILTVVLLASPILVLLIRHTVNTIQTFNKSIEISTQRLMTEKQKSDLLLSRMLPITVLRRLRAQREVPAEAFDAVTIFFSDIVGFTTISATSTPMEVINMLNMLYRLFDDRIMQYNVYKVETIGDAYMVVSGLPQRNGNRHASEIADMSLSLMRSLEGATVPHRPDEPLRIRAGINTGPCVAGVVGTTMPRYCLFGDTINVASRMESTGEAMKIHISYTTKKALDQIGGYEMQPRGIVDVAGKGSMETFWLVGKVGDEWQAESPQAMRLHDYDQSFLELLIRG